MVQTRRSPPMNQRVASSNSSWCFKESGYAVSRHHLCLDTSLSASSSLANPGVVIGQPNGIELFRTTIVPGNLTIARDNPLDTEPLCFLVGVEHYDEAPLAFLVHSSCYSDGRDMSPRSDRGTKGLVPVHSTRAMGPLLQLQDQGHQI